MENYGYHTKRIDKGVYGDFSKVKEEFEELEDAWNNRKSVALTICELADLYGSMKAFAEKTLNIPMEEIVKFSELTDEVYLSRKII